MSTLRNQQSKFTLNISKLITFAYERGYELTFGDAWAKDRHVRNSLHYSRLAVDFNLFRDGHYLDETPDHEELGLYWESLSADCKWGGHFNDGNHYEMKRP